MFVAPGLHVKSDYTYGGLYLRTSFIHKYKTSTQTPFVKSHDILDLALRNVLYVQWHVESAFTYNPGSTCHNMDFFPTEILNGVSVRSWTFASSCSAAPTRDRPSSVGLSSTANARSVQSIFLRDFILFSCTIQSLLLYTR